MIPPPLPCSERSRIMRRKWRACVCLLSLFDGSSIDFERAHSVEVSRAHVLATALPMTFMKVHNSKSLQ